MVGCWRGDSRCRGGRCGDGKRLGKMDDGGGSVALMCVGEEREGGAIVVK